MYAIMMSMNLSNIAISKIKNAECIISGISKNESINLIQSADLIKKVEHCKTKIYFHIYKWVKKFWRLATLKLTTTTTTTPKKKKKKKKNYYYESPIFLEDIYFLKIHIGKVFISFYISA